MSTELFLLWPFVICVFTGLLNYLVCFFSYWYPTFPRTTFNMLHKTYPNCLNSAVKPFRSMFIIITNEWQKFRVFKSDLSQGVLVFSYVPVFVPYCLSLWWCLSPLKEPWVVHHGKACKATVWELFLWSGPSHGSVTDGFSGIYREFRNWKQDSFLCFMWMLHCVLCQEGLRGGVFMFSCIYVFCVVLVYYPAALGRDKKEREQFIPTLKGYCIAFQKQTTQTMGAKVAEISLKTVFSKNKIKTIFTTGCWLKVQNGALKWHNTTLYIFSSYFLIWSWRMFFCALARIMNQN